MKRVRWITAGVAAAGLGLTSVATATAASASGHAPSGTRSIAAVLLSDGNRFDNNWHDYDIVTEAALAVLKAKPNSPVSAITKGDVALTVFAPSDQAFRNLARDITKKRYYSEEKVFNALVKAVGVNTIESVLLYHVVPGATITSAQALKSDGAVLKTALPKATIKVDVRSSPCWTAIELIDKDRDDRNAFVNLSAVDINKGNRQIAHGVTQVLRPINI
jgi:uncharacterized surface protein with fasciclin (FAS1) repeats